MVLLSLTRLKQASMTLPFLFLIALDIIRHRVWEEPLHTWTGIVLTAAVVGGLSVAFTLFLFQRIEALAAANSRLENKAEESLAFFQSLIKHSADAVIVSDPDGRIRLWNEGAVAMYGFSQKEAIGSRPLMVPPERHGEIEEMIGLALRGEVLRNFETQRRRKDGQLIDVMVTITPVKDPGGQLVAVLGISKDITHEKQMERRLQQLALLEERERIGMDLHDSVIQSIYAVALQLEDSADQVEAAPQAVRVRLNGAIDALHAVTQEIRSYILDLRPACRPDGDLVSGLATLLRGFEANSLVQGELRVAGDARGLGPDQVVHLLQLTREALANVQRHARATAVTVSVEQEEDRVRLKVQDNGVGFDPEAPSGAHQLGLRNMGARVRAAGGNLQVQSIPGAGTAILVTVPSTASASSTGEG